MSVRMSDISHSPSAGGGGDHSNRRSLIGDLNPDMLTPKLQPYHTQVTTSKRIFSSRRTKF